MINGGYWTNYQKVTRRQVAHFLIGCALAVVTASLIVWGNIWI